MTELPRDRNQGFLTGHAQVTFVTRGIRTNGDPPQLCMFLSGDVCNPLREQLLRFSFARLVTSTCEIEMLLANKGCVRRTQRAGAAVGWDPRDTGP